MIGICFHYAIIFQCFCIAYPSFYRITFTGWLCVVLMQRVPVVLPVISVYLTNLDSNSSENSRIRNDFVGFVGNFPFLLFLLSTQHSRCLLFTDISLHHRLRVFSGLVCLSIVLFLLRDSPLQLSESIF